MPSRRDFLIMAGAMGVGALATACQQSNTPDASPTAGSSAAVPGVSDSASPVLARYPEKTDLILLADRPPLLETPLKYFHTDLTPNDAFYVRWHLSGIPTSVDTTTWRLDVGGKVKQALHLSLDQLRADFPKISLVAVNECSGNARALFEPPVPGGQWQNGAMGCARWTGVRLKDVLEKAGIDSKAVDVTFQGLDTPPYPTIPAFVKSLSAAHALGGDVMIAYEMNDALLPMLNGFPVRLVVPGWYATYWVKSLTKIVVLDKKFDGYWMEKAYRIPKNADASETPTALATDTVPINRLSLRSVFVVPEPNAQIPVGKPFDVQGVAFDGGTGISAVEFSTNGKDWLPATLEPDLGKFAWRRWKATWTPDVAGAATLQVHARSMGGEQQRTSQWNHGGYQRNVIESVPVTVV